MTLFRRAAAVVQSELSLFSRYPRLRWTLPGLLIIPALYAFIYLDSVWDPASRTALLPVALVNLDQGADWGGQRVELGAELVRTLQQQRAFGFHAETDTEAARRAVRSGRSVFALVIPADFTASALAADAPGAGKLVVFASEGNNYAGAGFARRFAAELGHRVNETLNERRWAVVLGSAATSQGEIERLRGGVEQLRVGAVELQTGLGTLRDGSAALQTGSQRLSEGVGAGVDGMRELGGGLRTLDARRPAPADLQALREGAQRMQAGHDDWARQMPRLEEGARTLAQGTEQFRDQVTQIPLIGDRLGEGADQLLAGSISLHTGLRQATEGARQLAARSRPLTTGVLQLTDGFAAHAAAVGTLTQRFPADDRLDEWVGGARQVSEGAAQLRAGLVPLQAGAARLSAGLDTVAKSLPASPAGPTGTPQGLAVSVEPQLEIDAPVGNNGMGFLPNFIPVALWLGAVMTAFVFHLRRVPVSLQDTSNGSLFLGKMAFLGSINLAQAVCVLLMCEVLLGLQPVHVVGLALTMAVSAITFMLLILLLVRLLGDVGKGAALVLLIVQLSAAGGVMPIELTSDFYGLISPWLPFTWSIRAVRASAFGAFGSEWGAALGVLLLFTATFGGLSLLVGRWKFVEPAEHRPAMDI